MVSTITLDELRAELEAREPLTLVEALGPMYYEDAHLPGAINIPHERVDELATSLLRPVSDLLRTGLQRRFDTTDRAAVVRPARAERP